MNKKLLYGITLGILFNAMMFSHYAQAVDYTVPDDGTLSEAVNAATEAGLDRPYEVSVTENSDLTVEPTANMYIAGIIDAATNAPSVSLTLSTGLNIAGTSADYLKLSNLLINATNSHVTIQTNGSFILDNVTYTDINGTSLITNSGGKLNINSSNITNTNIASSSELKFTGNSVLDNSSVVLTENTVASVFLSDGTIFQNGNAVDGGALNIGNGVDSNVTGSTFISNTATNNGGAIYNTSDNLVIKNSVFGGDTPTKGNTALQGGAIYTTGEAEISGTNFQNNSATQSGGAIHNTGILKVNGGSTFNNNSADEDGGAVYNENELNISGNTSFTSNNAVNNGGAIYNDTAGKTIINEEVAFTSNSAEDGGAVYNKGELNISGNTSFTSNTATGSGGAIYNTSDNLVISNSKFGGDFEMQGNKAQSGGAVYNTGKSQVTGSVFKNNNADGNGGAFYNSGSFTSVSNSFENNSAQKGGAIYNAQTGTVLVNENNSFTANTAVEGGAIYNEGNLTIAENTAFTSNTATGSGGAIYNNSDLLINKLTFTSNSAAVHGGAIYNANGNLTVSDSFFGGTEDSLKNQAAQGGAIYNKLGQLNITGSQFTNNTSDRGSGGAIYTSDVANIISSVFSGNSSAFGGAVYSNGSLLNIENSIFTGNNNPSTIFHSAGGAILSDADILTVSGSQFIGNYSYSMGGAIAANSDTKIDNTLFKDNESATEGGAVYNLNKINITNSTFTNNYAGDSGGALYNDGGTAEIVQSVFDGNTAENTGGGAILNSNILTISNSEFKNNDTLGMGGAILNEAGAETKISSSEFSNNSSGFGGALYGKLWSNFDAENVKFDSNTADTYGGAITTSGAANIKNSTFSNNSAAIGGAIMAMSGSNINIGSNTAFINNTSENGGGAIALAGQNPYTGKFEDAAVVNLNSTEDGSAIVFEGNKMGSANEYSNAIAMMGNSVLNMNASNGGSILIKDSVAAQGENNIINVNMNNPAGAANNGNILISSIYAPDAKFNIGKGTINIAPHDGSTIPKILSFGNVTMNDGARINSINNEIDTLQTSALKVYGTSYFNPDINLDNLTNDMIDNPLVGYSTTPLGGTIVVDDYNAFGTLKKNSLKVKILTNEDPNIKVSTTSDKVLTNPIGTMGLSGGGSNYLEFGYKSFHPETYRFQAMQMAAYANQLVVNSTLFDRIGDRIIFTKGVDNVPLKVEMSGSYNVYKNKNSLASYPAESGGLWFRPYSNFEKINLNRGFKVNNTQYGAIFGADLPAGHFENGSHFIGTLFGGYTGSMQDYGNIDGDQNGGFGGVMGTVYKNNFYSSFLANLGGLGTDVKVFDKKDNFNMFTASFASKSGYNFNVTENFTIQPTAMLSYSYFSPSKFNSEYFDLPIRVERFQAIQMTPGLNLIWTQDTFSLYLTAQYVWNINKNYGKVYDIDLPYMQLDPYLEYGIGFTKHMGERFASYGQFTARNIGRTGFGFQLGAKYKM